MFCKLPVFALAITLMGGCAGKLPPETIIVKVPEIQVVEVPVPVKVEPPAELLEPLGVVLPEFIQPTDPEASSALTPEGERLLRILLEQLLTRIEAWEAWASGE